MHSKEEGGNFIESLQRKNKYREYEARPKAGKREKENGEKVAQSLRFELHVVRISEKERLGRFLYEQETT